MIHPPGGFLMGRLAPLAFTALLMTFGGCNAAEELLDGEEAELKEAELPNCSRIITCCANLKGRGIAPDECEDAFIPAADQVISTYQAARDNIPFDDAEARTLLRDETQGTVEPGCRCFLEETIGQIDDALLPIDCESDKNVGTLEGDLQCSDATDALLDAAADN